MTTKKKSALVEAVLALDEEFSQLERLSGEIERLDIDTDNGLERARQLLLRFGETGQKVGDGVQTMAKALDQARLGAEAAAKSVQARAELIQKRQEQANHMIERFQALSEMVRKLSTAMAQLQKSKNDLTEEDVGMMRSSLPQLTSQLEVLIAEGQKLKEEASSANLKNFARDADSLSQSLLAAQRKLAGLVQ